MSSYAYFKPRLHAIYYSPPAHIPMPTIKDTEQARLESDIKLHEAIKQWRPDRPRRWLAKYGSWPAEGRGPLAERYRALRREAEMLLARPRIESANGLPSHVFNLE